LRNPFPRPDPYHWKMTSSDDTLLAAMAAGDANAAAAFVRRFQRPVYGLAVTMLHDRALAEDLAQDVFVKAWRNAAGYDVRRGSVVSWLLGITRNAAIDVLRLKRADPVDPDVLDARLQADSDTTEPAVGHEERARVREALATLTPEQRRAVFMATYLGRTASEISEVEHIPIGTAKTRIRSGMMRLRLTLETADES
jgi:RNA polymerase sigma factor (sigma-70 family)